MQSRTSVAVIVFCVMAAILVQRLFYLQIVRGADYAEDYELQIQKTKETEGTRGNIYDRNGNLLAYNELAYSVTFEYSDDYKNKELNKIVSTVIQMVEANGDSVINDFGIVLDNNDNYVYIADNDTERLRFIADVFGLRTIDQLDDEQRNISAEDLIDYLCTDDVYGYDIDQSKMSHADVLKLVNIRYAISLNSYQQWLSTTIAEDVSEETVADIMEHMDTLPGVSIEQESLRRYTDSYCFANMIGYTGQISQEEYDALDKEEQEDYSLTDTVGKSGLEQVMDSYLKGEKGSETLYVNSVGRVIDRVKSKEEKAGNDLYLTIDANLQKAAYHIIEQELAGILLAKIQNTLDFDRTQVDDGSDVIIPIGDVYNAFIDNEMVDMTHFGEDDAQAAEKEVYAAFTARKEQVLQEIQNVLSDPNASAYQDAGREQQAYQSYIVNTVLNQNSGILMGSAIDTSDETYQAWREDETINIYTFLNYAISKNWIDTSLLKDYVSSEGEYSDSSETYQAIISYVIDAISDDTEFDKLIYQYMIKAGSVTGRQLCMILYEQGVLTFDEGQYNALNSGSMGAYDFVRSKIQSLEITPGELGLEPCTGSMVMTDPKSGEVLACVSYPGYDNNRLANTMDSDYYNKLNKDNASPMYNTATQERTAPGSTYKPLVALTGLTEGVIDTGTYFTCHGEYDKVDPHPRCWIYPNAHGSLSVEGAIQNSCNCFFYEVGYQLSLDRSSASADDDGDGTSDNVTFSSDLGTDKLRKYAVEFGLGDTSGLEIPESDPQISDETSVLSAIGQGNNNFTTSQLARYITAVANEGTVYNLSLLDKVVSVDGETVKDFTPEVKNTITDISSTSWNAVHNGMRNVISVAQAQVFSKLNASGVEVSGKTGTAQQSDTHPDHALFVGFAQSSDPEVAFAVRIANGYSSTYAAEIGNDVMEYYYQITPEEELITGTASEIAASTTGD
nr:penicillin-binding transpeptidase domain-containing protein [uncultured Merdimonas sp.]